MSIIFMYLAGVLVSVYPIYFIMLYNLETCKCNSVDEAKDTAVMCAWVWFLSFPVILAHIAFVRINKLISDRL